MTQKKHNANTDWREIFSKDRDGLRTLVQEVVQEVLEAEMDETVGAQKGERSPERGRVPVWVLHADAGDASGQTGAASTARPTRKIWDGSVRALPAE